MNTEYDLAEDAYYEERDRDKPRCGCGEMRDVITCQECGATRCEGCIDSLTLAALNACSDECGEKAVRSLERDIARRATPPGPQVRDEVAAIHAQSARIARARAEMAAEMAELDAKEAA